MVAAAGHWMVPDAGWPAIASEPPTSRTYGMVGVVNGARLRFVFSALIRSCPSLPTPPATLPSAPK